MKGMKTGMKSGVRSMKDGVKKMKMPKKEVHTSFFIIFMTVRLLQSLSEEA